MSSKIGEGTYSTVVAKGNSAVKIIEPKHFECGIREVVFVRHCDHPNVIKFQDVVITPDRRVSIYMKKYNGDLNRLLKEKSLSIEEIMGYSYDILNAVDYIHSRGIIHCDLKPKNLLIDKRNSCIVICDFGISVLGEEKYYTSHIQTSTYRAPEIDFGQNYLRFNEAIDMWSVGCMLYEMVTGTPFLKYTTDTEDSTVFICKTLNITAAARSDALYILNRLDKETIMKNICHLMLDVDAPKYNCLFRCGFIELMSRCLLPNPAERVTACEAIRIIRRLLFPLDTTTPSYTVKRLKLPHCPDGTGPFAKESPLYKKNKEQSILEGISPYIIYKSSENCIHLAKSIASRGAFKPRFNYAVLYIAASIYSSEYAVLTEIENECDREKLLDNIIKVLTKTGYNLLE
jgi:serine/threonine protein kinase